jgi:hypothetical protein
MADMDELVEFLRARLDEEAAAAREASGRWRRAGINSVEDSDGRLVIYGDGSAPTSAEAEHIASHDPARVLADVEAKRRIVAELEHADPYDMDYWGGRGGYDRAQTTLRLLALPYVDHPDYRQEWRP